MSVLAILDIYSSYDAIHHFILVHRLHTLDLLILSFKRLSAYLTDHTKCVSLSNNCYVFAPLHSGLPQGSVIGPMLFSMYIKPLSAITDSHSITLHSFADD